MNNILNNLRGRVSITVPCFVFRFLVRKRTIPAERPPYVGEVSANFLRIEDVAWSAQRIPTAVNLGFLDRLSYHTLVK
jgi:hypothetical protein